MEMIYLSLNISTQIKIFESREELSGMSLLFRADCRTDRFWVLAAPDCRYSTVAEKVHDRSDWQPV